MTKGTIEYKGERIDGLTPNDLVKRGVIQVMEGRHCFGHLTVEENLMTGAYTRTEGRAAIQRDLEMVYTYFPRLKERRRSQAGYTSGGEQQMTAIGRALMSRPKMILLDEPSMGLAPQVVEEIFEIVVKLNREQGVSFLLAEQNTSIALRHAHYGYILENGRVVLDGSAEALRGEDDVKNSTSASRCCRRPQVVSATSSITSAPQTLAGVGVLALEGRVPAGRVWRRNRRSAGAFPRWAWNFSTIWKPRDRPLREERQLAELRGQIENAR